MNKYIGFDMSDKQTIACVIGTEKQESYAALPTEVADLRRWLAGQKKGGHRLHLTFEVCGRARFLYDHLRDAVETLSVSNPAQMTWIYRTAKKTDRMDARKMAVLLKLGELPVVHMPSKAVRQGRGQIQHRRQLLHTQTQIKNRIRALLKGQGYDKAAFAGSWWKRANRQEMGSLVEQSAEPWTERLEDLLEQLALYEHQAARLTKRLDQRLAGQAGASLLQSIPGVGPRTAEAVLAYTDEGERFRGGKEYGSYFGVTPKLDESGSTRRLGHISKQGPSVVRWLIVESAWRAIRQSPALWEFYERVRRRQDQRKKTAIVATARKILSVMRAMLRTGELFNEALVLKQEQLTRGASQGRCRCRDFYK
jgi:transposase